MKTSKRISGYVIIQKNFEGKEIRRYSELGAFSHDQVRTIRRAVKVGASIPELAKLYKVTPVTIRRMARRQTYRNVS